MKEAQNEVVNISLFADYIVMNFELTNTNVEKYSPFI